MSSSSLLVVLLIGVLAFSAVVNCQTPASTGDFDARAFFQGEWELEYTRHAAGAAAAPAKAEPVPVEVLRWNVSAPFVGSPLLRGVSTDASERMTKLMIEFDEVLLTAPGEEPAKSLVRKGVFYAASQSFLFRSELFDEPASDEDEHVVDDSANSDDEEEEEEEVVAAAVADADERQLERLFDFDFHHYPSNIFYSSGAWGKDGKWLYQLSVTNPQAFLLSVFETDADGRPTTVHFVLGKKHVPPPEKTFFQKYMQFFFLGGIMIYQFMQFKRRQAAQGPEDQQQQQQEGAAAPAQAAVSRVRTGANAEVVTDGKKKN